MKNNNVMDERIKFFNAASLAVIGFGIMVSALVIQTSLVLSGTMSALISLTMVFGVAIMMLNVILACDALSDMLEQKEESEHEQFIVYDYEGTNIVRKAS